MQQPPYQISFSQTLNKDNLENIDKENDVLKITSKIIPLPFNADTFILTPCAIMPKGSCITIEIKFFKGPSKTQWLKYLHIEKNNNLSFNEKNELGHFDTDIFKAAEYIDSFKYRITAKGKVSFNSLNCVITKHKALFDLEAATEQADQPSVILNIKPISQIQHGFERKNRICSPTCIAMALDYFGISSSLQETVDGVYDKKADTYGNWVFNASYAGLYGLENAVIRCDTVKQAQNIVSAGIPLIASISFKEGELKSAPQKETPGHLVLIKGFTKQGDFIVNDPGAETDAQVEKIYDKTEFAAAWLKNKKGLCYKISKQKGT
ncbi:hypothetical protein Emin_0134 [Elusimicrobium minutum Pei191]|uniref:Peptidase C39-like domain-containing protein n=1 Tax=Elusimicrobium minutum (strain Pei191) TaxID=445932 RepID=B2KBL3_ELUMP|nr:C39 family peptidase [Elusimicrobium minutum]ACC97700.1 hypothetical protein Emin_0134 [Elusimicrobium minutum Pei191]